MTKPDDFDPKGIRVLAVDANIISLGYLLTLLRKCKYEVTGLTDTGKALEALRENRDKFDIVITDVVGQGMDGFKFLEMIGLEMDLPVIMVSADDSKSNIMRGIEHGARDYILKPVRIQEIRNIWQHVFRKRMESSITREISDPGPLEMKMKSKEMEPKNIQTNASASSSSSSSRQKKPRITWTPELHRKFLESVQKLGEVVHPKKVLEIMNEPGLTRNHIASHLQKYRSMLKKHRDVHQSTSDSGLNSYENRNGSVERMAQEMNVHISPPVIPQFKDFNFSTYIKNIGFPYEYLRPDNVGFNDYSKAGSRTVLYSQPSVSHSNPYPQKIISHASSGMPSVSNMAFGIDPFQSLFPGQQEMGEPTINGFNPREGENSKRDLAMVNPDTNGKPPPGTLQLENNSRQSSGICIDDDLYAAIKGFINEGTPQL